MKKIACLIFALALLARLLADPRRVRAAVVRALEDVVVVRGRVERLCARRALEAARVRRVPPVHEHAVARHHDRAAAHEAQLVPAAALRVHCVFPLHVLLCAGIARAWHRVVLSARLEPRLLQRLARCRSSLCDPRCCCWLLLLLLLL